MKSGGCTIPHLSSVSFQAKAMPSGHDALSTTRRCVARFMLSFHSLVLIATLLCSIAVNGAGTFFDIVQQLDNGWVLSKVLSLHRPRGQIERDRERERVPTKDHSAPDGVASLKVRKGAFDALNQGSEALGR